MRAHLLLLAALIVVLPASAARASVWTAVNRPTAQPLYGVAALDSATWVAVGGGGVILRSTDAGLDWTSIPSPVGDPLRAVAFHGDVGVAVGIAGRVIRTADRGLTWVAEARPTTKALYGVSMGDGFAVITGEEGRILVSHDDGLTWATHFAGTASVLFGASVRGGGAVGAGGQGAIVMSTDVGAGWGLTVPGGQLTFFYAVDMVTPQTGWIVGTASSVPSLIARTDASGFAWIAQTAPSNDILFGVSFTDTSSGTAVGQNGAIVHTADGGALWSLESSGTTAALNAVRFASPALGIAVGDSGVVLRASPDPTAAVDPARPGAPRLALGVLGNPVVGSARARFALTLPADAPVSLRVFDTAGRVVATLAEGGMAAGRHELDWTRGGDRGARASAGVYFAELRSGAAIARTKFILLD